MPSSVLRGLHALNPLITATALWISFPQMRKRSYLGKLRNVSVKSVIKGNLPFGQNLEQCILLSVLYGLGNTQKGPMELSSRTTDGEHGGSHTIRACVLHCCLAHRTTSNSKAVFPYCCHIRSIGSCPNRGPCSFTLVVSWTILFLPLPYSPPSSTQLNPSSFTKPVLTTVVKTVFTLLFPLATESKLVLLTAWRANRWRDELLGQGIVIYSESQQPEKMVDEWPKEPSSPS